MEIVLLLLRVHANPFLRTNVRLKTLLEKYSKKTAREKAGNSGYTEVVALLRNYEQDFEKLKGEIFTQLFSMLNLF